MSTVRNFLSRFRPTAVDTHIQSTIAEAARVQAEQRRREQYELEQRDRITALEHAVDRASQRVDIERRADYIERCHELVEAKQMAGSGPWLVAEARGKVGTPDLGVAIRESNPLLSQGGTYDLELMLQNIEWKRETNLAWMEFSRWGIQQIILVSRLYYIKNPIIRRLIDVCAAYVFARGVETSSEDETANEVLKDFFARNSKVFGHVGSVNCEKRKDYDGNLFWCLFSDTANKGEVNVRIIDATEMQDIVSDPDDADTPWFYRRIWTERRFDPAAGVTTTQQREAWYPALGYDPVDKPKTMAGHDVHWDKPVYHRKCGGVANWQFGCPRAYPALDWAREGKKTLESAYSVLHALAQVAITITTKGGQQALMGLKQQLQTTVGPTAPVWDSNPPPVNASIFAAGTGTEMKAFQTQGAGIDPDYCRQAKLMCAMVFGVPETFLGDVKTGNLATASSLDRPTETVMLERQEEWIEDRNTIATYVLKVSAGAPSGKLQEAHRGEVVTIREAAYKRDDRGRRIYEAEQAQPGEITVKTSFPAIREGDIPTLVGAIVKAMTLDNRGGQVVGTDEKESVRLLLKTLDFPGADELVESMYPEGEYEPDRTKQVLDAPVPKLADRPGGTPAEQDTVPHTEAAISRLKEALDGWKPNGHA